MKYVLIITLIILSVIGVYMLKPDAKHIYSVRENLDPQESSVSWDLYCHYDYGNGKINKKYIGNFVQYGGGNPERVETSLCN